MSYSASQILDLIAPQFSSNANKADYIAIATSSTNECVFGDNYAQAIALRAAHMIELATRLGGSGSAGSIASKREGDLSIGFRTSGISGDLGQTSYGVQLQGLIDGNIPQLGVTGGLDDGC